MGRRRRELEAGGPLPLALARLGVAPVALSARALGSAAYAPVMPVETGRVANDEAGPAGGRGVQTRQDRLQDVLALTEAGLARLEFRDLLLELLQRIREVLDTATAAIFVLEEKPRELVAWAAVGIDEESLRRERVPIGVGFAGRVALMRQTLTLNDVGPVP